MNGKLYLNYNADVQNKWSSDVSDYLKKADALWPTAQSQSKVIDQTPTKARKKEHSP